MGTILRPRKEVSKRGWGWQTWRLPFSFRSLCLLSPNPKHLSLARVNARLSWLNRMAWWMEGNIGKFGGRGNVTARGRCGRGRYMGLFFPRSQHSGDDVHYPQGKSRHCCVLLLITFLLPVLATVSEGCWCVVSYSSRLAYFISDGLFAVYISITTLLGALCSLVFLLSLSKEHKGEHLVCV